MSETLKVGVPFRHDGVMAYLDVLRKRGLLMVTGFSADLTSSGQAPNVVETALMPFSNRLVSTLCGLLPKLQSGVQIPQPRTGHTKDNEMAKQQVAILLGLISVIRLK